MTPARPRRTWLRVVLIVVLAVVALFVALTVAGVALWLSMTA